MSVVPRCSAIRDRLTGVVLAGGRATRMGGLDKGLIAIAGRPMAAWVVDALARQAGQVLINANRNVAQYAALGAAVVCDEGSGYAGPLAGIAAAMGRADTEFIVTAPCDSPLVCADLVTRLAVPLLARDSAIAVAFAAGRLQPVFSLLRRDLKAALDDYLGRGERKIDRWFAATGYVEVDFSDVPDTFLNVNSPRDTERVAARLRAGQG